MRILTVLILLLPYYTYGQGSTDSLIKTFYNQTMAYYFLDSANTKDQLGYSCILLQTDFDTLQLIKDITTPNIVFLSSKTDKKSVLDRPLKSNKGRNIYWIKHTTIAKDTIDINIGGWTIQSASTKRLELGAWCGGTMGYVPTTRYIYDKETSKWHMITEKDIILQLIDNANSH